MLLGSDLNSTVTGIGTLPGPYTTTDLDNSELINYITDDPTFVAGDYGTCLATFPWGSGGLTSESQWVWGSPDGQCTINEAKGEIIRIEETIDLWNLSGTFTLGFATDNVSAAYVNGTEVGTNEGWVSKTHVELTNLVAGSNTIEIRAGNGGGPAGVKFELRGPEQPTWVDINVKPGNGDETDPINPHAKANIPVAVYSTDDFDATTLDVSSLAFGPGSASAAHGGHVEDVDGDGLMDLVLHFPTEDAGFADGDTRATLVGQTTDGTDVVGTDVIKTVGGKGKGKGKGRGR